jgi:hypothetical protein
MEPTTRKKEHIQPASKPNTYICMEQSVAKSRVKQSLALCRHDEYGIGNLKRRVMIKQSYLYKELMLRLEGRKITEKYYCLNEKGMFNWKTHGKHKESMRKSFDFLRHTLASERNRMPVSLRGGGGELGNLKP